MRTMTRGNIPGWKEIVARDKGEHSYYKWKGTALHIERWWSAQGRSSQEGREGKL